MNFDLSKFPEVMQFLFSSAISLYQSLNFNFGDFTVNGWVLMIGSAIFFIVVKFIARLFD